MGMDGSGWIRTDQNGPRWARKGQDRSRQDLSEQDRSRRDKKVVTDQDMTGSDKMGQDSSGLVGTFEFVCLCVTYTAMHKFCACYLQIFYHSSKNRIGHDRAGQFMSEHVRTECFWM